MWSSVLFKCARHQAALVHATGCCSICPLFLTWSQDPPLLVSRSKASTCKKQRCFRRWDGRCNVVADDWWNFLLIAACRSVQCFSKPIKSLPRCTHNYLRTCTLHGFREQRDNLNYFWCTLLKMPLSWRSWRLKGLTWLVVISITKGKEEGKGRFFFQFEELDNFTICWVPYYLTVCQTSSGSCTRHLRGAEKCLQNTEHGQRLLLLELHKYVLDPHLEYDWDYQNWEGAGKLPLSHVDRYLVVAQLESSKQLQSAY